MPKAKTVSVASGAVTLGATVRKVTFFSQKQVIMKTNSHDYQFTDLQIKSFTYMSSIYYSTDFCFG